MSEPFKFKEFSIRQDRCAMKVGTDGVLLGAWTHLDHQPNTILDIGAGTGLISLMLAQRSSAEIIDAIEIEGAAYEQCVENFEASSWGDRLFCYHAGWDEFTDEIDDPYDLIVCNPPFYSENVSSENTARDTARQSQFLPLKELALGVPKLLSEKGLFSIIIPFKEEDSFLDLMESQGLFPKYITHVKGNKNTQIKRSLMALQFQKTEVIKDVLVIEMERHQYTEAYKSLTKDFYLKM